MPVLSQLSLHPAGKVEKRIPSQRLPSLYELQSTSSSKLPSHRSCQVSPANMQEWAATLGFQRDSQQHWIYLFFVSKNGKM